MQRCSALVLNQLELFHELADKTFYSMVRKLYSGTCGWLGGNQKDLNVVFSFTIFQH